MLPPHMPRPLWRSFFSTVIVLGGLLSLVPAAQASSFHAFVEDDSTEVPDWARRIAQVRRLVADAGAAPAREAADQAALAFSEARTLAADSAFRYDEGIRALALDAQHLYERHFGPVHSVALTTEELGALRGAHLLALTDGEWKNFDPGVDLEEVPVAVVSRTLLYPEDAERFIAREAERYASRMRGIQQRARRYFPMIERTLAGRGLPIELKYMTVIESALDPSAVSSAGAIGLWQILPSTGAMYGVSEGALYGPRASTRTAVRYLAYLGDLFDQDWQLALAAYNCGPGRVQQIVRQAEHRLGHTPTFWDIRHQLPAETRAYVPRFIAVARAFGESI